MKIKDVILNATVYLGLFGVHDYLVATPTPSNPDQGVLSQLNSLTILANLVCSELASESGIYLKNTQTVNPSNGRVNYSALTNNPIKILSVEDELGNTAMFEEERTYFKTFISPAVVTYAYMPSNLGLLDEIGYSEKDISTTVISYGLCAEYCLTVGRFDEAVKWRDRFIGGIERAVSPKNAKVKERVWA